MPNYNSDNYEDGNMPATEKEQEHEAKKKLLKTTAKGFATFKGGPEAGQAVDKIAETKLGDKVLDKLASKSNPQVGKLAKKLADKGAIDAADKAIDMAGGSQGGGTPGMPGTPSMPGTPGMPEGSNPSGDIGVTDNSSQMDGGNPIDPNMSFGGKKKNSSILDDNEGGSETEFSGELFGTGFGKIAKIVIPIAALFSPFLIIILLVYMISTNLFIYEDALGISDASGGSTGDIIYEATDGEAKDFYERVNEVKLEMQAEGKSVDALKVVATYHIISQYDESISYKQMSKRKIRNIAEAMFDGNTYSETVFRDNLTNDIFKSYFPKATQTRREELTDEVFQYISDYYEFIGEDYGTCSAAGSCTYTINGFYSPSTGNITKNMTITNLKVRLVYAGGAYGPGPWGAVIEGEELVDFEKYILGVAYGELYSHYDEDAFKAQFVAARSFALSRPATMNNANGKKLEEENGQWILQLCPGVADQVYCNPDLGCSRMNDGEQGGTIRSGHSVGTYRSPVLPEDSPIRAWAKEVEGEVLVNNQGNIINTSYVNTTQEKFQSLALQGLDYKQILLQVYGSSYGATDIQKMSCQGASGNCGTTSTGPYSTWKQTDAKWKNVKLGSSTVGSIGCLATSVSMLIAKSGVATNVVGEFNPGTFVEYLSDRGGFVNGNFQWYTVNQIAPSFNYVGRKSVEGFTETQKVNAIKDLLGQGYYVVAKVSTTPQHWVAIDSVTGNQVNILDPSDSSTILGERYPISETTSLAYFKVG